MASYIGVDIGGTKIKAGLISERLIVKKTIVFLTEASKGPDHVKENICNAIREVWADDVKAIGVGFPAPVDNTGTIHGAKNLPGWEKINLKKFLEQRFKKRIVIDNDANCFALAESRLGAGKKEGIVVGLIVGTGLGCGIVIGQKLYSGANNAAGEIGGIPFKGITLEEYAAGPALKRLSTYQGLSLNPIQLADMAKNNKGFAKNVFKEYGTNLGVALSVIVDTFDPDMIVLGGSVSKSFNYFKGTMMESLKKYIFPVAAKNIKVVRGKLPEASVIGAALVAMDKI